MAMIEVVCCKECQFRIVNVHVGEPGYSNLKAMCAFDTGDIFALGRRAEDDDWFCADGIKKEKDEH